MAIKLKQNNANIELKNLGQTIKGEDGGYYIPSVDESGELSWTTSKSGMTSVASANIKGPAGEPGPRGEQGEPGKDGNVSFDSLTDAQTAPLKGEKGDAGAPGKDGNDGAAATIEIGTVSAGTEAIVTNSGTSSAAILNFTIPKGEKGETGASGEKGEPGAAGKDGLTTSITMNDITHTQVDGNIDLGTVITEHQDVNGKEDKTNKVTSISANSTDTQYPSAKCVYDLVGNVETILNTLNSGGGAS